MAYEIHTKSVELDGIVYIVKNGRVTVEDLQPWKEPIRQIGNQRRSDRTNLTQQTYEDLRFGVGFPSTKGPVPIEDEVGDPSYRGFFSSTVETRFLGQITLAGQVEDATHELDNAETSDHTYGRLHVGSGKSSAGPHPTVLAYSTVANESIAQLQGGGADDWPEIEDLTGESLALIRTTFDHKGEVFGMGGTATTPWTKISKVASDGATSLLTVTSNVSEPTYSAVSFRDLIITAGVVSTTGEIVIHTSSNNGVDFSLLAGMHASTDEFNPVAQLVVYKDSSGSPAVMLHTSSHLYLLNFAEEFLEEVAAFPIRSDIVVTNPPRPRTVNGLLYLGRGRELTEYHYSGAYRDISPLTQARLDPTQFHPNSTVTAMCSAGKELMVGFSGGTTAEVWAYTGDGFHYIASVGSGGIILLSDIAVANVQVYPDSLHMVYSEAGITDNSDFKYVRHVLREPKSLGANKKFATSGFITFPLSSGGMPEVEGNLVQLGADLEDTTAGETVIVTVDQDKAGSFSNALQWDDDPTSGTQQYASGAGLDTKVWQFKATLASDADADSPLILSFVSYFEKLYPDLNRYTFDIDVRATMEINKTKFPMGNAKQLLAPLLNSRKKKTLLPFETGSEDADDGTSPRFVRIESMPHISENRGAETTGVTDVSTEEFIRVICADRA